MPRYSRRAILRAVSLSITAGLAGCNGLNRNTTETESPTQTATPTATATTTLEPTATDDTRKPTTSTPKVAESVGTPALTQNPGTSIPEFGRAVALSNETAIVMAEGKGAYVFENDGDWSQAAVLTPNDDQNFGGHKLSASIVGDEAILGGPEAGADRGTGAAYLFERVGDEWTQRHQFTSGEDTDEFARAVAFEGDRVVVGDAHEPQTMVPWTGDAYVFQRDGNTWTREAHLTTEAGDLFGTSVALDGETVLIGAPYAKPDDEMVGVVYGYGLTDGEWQRQSTLTPDESMDDGQFGQSVTVDGDTAVVGAPDGAGSAYVFERVDGKWKQQARVTAEDGESGEDFGRSVTVAGKRAIIGAPYGGQTGEAYVLRKNDDWRVTRQLTAANLAENTEFGHAVALDAATALIGAPAFEVPTSAYLFTL